MDINESLLDLNEAAALPAFRTRGRKPHVSALYRWIHGGVAARDGHRVRLETIKTPSGLKTSVEAVARFIAALSGEKPLPAPASSQRKKQIALAEAELAQAGFEVGGDGK